jgi:MFS family permease
MRPIARETIVDRRQPSLRWTAVIAGATVGVALWVLLQVIGMGAGLATVNLDDSGSLRSVGIGTTVWTILAPLIALFIGGLVAGRIADTFDYKVGAMHGFVAWSIASLAGVLAVAWLVSAIAGGAARMAYTELPMSKSVEVDPTMRAQEIAQATDTTGKILLGAGVTLLLGLGAAVGGGAIGARNLPRQRQRTQEVPVVPPPAEPPVDAPHVKPKETP